MESIILIGESVDLALMPYKLFPGDCSTQGPCDIRGDRAPMPCLGDHGPSFLDVSFPAEDLFVFPAKPTRVAVELMLSQSMA
jgi:hypothetical protein